jgi:hypothetical protein
MYNLAHLITMMKGWVLLFYKFKVRSITLQKNLVGMIEIEQYLASGSHNLVYLITMVRKINLLCVKVKGQGHSIT